MNVLSSVEEVRAVVLSGRHRLPSQTVVLSDSLGLVLARPIVATHPVPPFTNSAMDGYALRSADTTSGSAPLRVVGETMAGEAAGRLGQGEAIRIMTGAPLPDGADAVAPIEDTNLDENGRVVVPRAVTAGANVRRAGEDVVSGAVVLAAGTALGAAHVGLLASLGQQQLEVYPRPRVGVLSTGDELVDDGRPLGPGEIRDANRPALLAAVRESGFIGVDLGLVGDEESAIRQTITDALAKGRAPARGGGRSGIDALVISGGVSVGDRDAVFLALSGLGGTTQDFRVMMRPGRPFVFAEIADTPVFALPGNPAAAMIAFELFSRPLLRAMAGQEQLERPVLRAVADEALRRRRDGKVHYVRVAVSVGPDGGLHVRSAGAQNSHLLSVTAAAAGLVVLGDGEGASPGEIVEVIVLDWDRVAT